MNQLYNHEIATLLAMNGVLLFFVAITYLILRWEKFTWWLYQQRLFQKYVAAQNERITFLQLCGVTEIVALATVLKDVTDRYVSLQDPKNNKFESPEVDPLNEFIKHLVSRIRSAALRNDVPDDQRVIALDVCNNTCERVIGSLKQLLVYRVGFARRWVV